MSETFTFHMRVVDRDNDSYYVTRWDLATPLSVRAANRDEAFRSCFAVMGNPPRYRRWVARIDKIEAAS